MKIVGTILLLVGMASIALAEPINAPEINPGSAASAIALISGAVLVIRGRHKK